MTVTGDALAASAGDAEERGSMRPSEEKRGMITRGGEEAKAKKRRKKFEEDEG